MRPRTLRLALAAAPFLLAPLPAHAQTPIRLGQTVTSQLAESDPRVSENDRSHYKAYLYHGRRGEAVRVTMRSSEFDSFLSLGQRSSGDYQMRSINDDGAGGNDAQINYVFPEDGDYEIHANSVGDVTGGFTLLVEAGTPPGPVVNRPIRLGQTVQGTLSERSPQESDATFYEQYVFQGRAGQRVQVTQRSSDFDSYLNVGRLDGATYSSIKTDDDGAGGNDARVVITLPADGQYAIHANSLSRATGAFTLVLEEGTPPPPMSMQEIRVGQTVSGTLDSSDPEADDGSYIDQYVYRGQAGERLVITLRSSAFDAYLAYGSLNGGTFSRIDSDDDSGGGTDSRLEVTLPADGTYAIHANSLMGGATGAYTLTVERSEAPASSPSTSKGGCS